MVFLRNQEGLEPELLEYIKKPSAKHGREQTFIWKKKQEGAPQTPIVYRKKNLTCMGDSTDFIQGDRSTIQSSKMLI